MTVARTFALATICLVAVMGWPVLAVVAYALGEHYATGDLLWWAALVVVLWLVALLVDLWFWLWRNFLRS